MSLYDQIDRLYFNLRMIFKDVNSTEKSFDWIINKMENYFKFIQMESSEVGSITHSIGPLRYNGKEQIFLNYPKDVKSASLSDHGPNPIIWKGYMEVNSKYYTNFDFHSLIHRICAYDGSCSDDESFNIIWQFDGNLSPNYNQFSSELSIKNYEPSSWEVKSFSFGNIIDGHRFVSHLNSQNYEEKFDSILIDQISFRISHLYGYCQLKFRLTYWEDGQMEVNTFILRYESESIDEILVNSPSQGDIKLYFLSSCPPLVFTKLRTRTMDNRLMVKYIGKCRVLKLSVDNYESLLMVREYTNFPLNVHFASVPFSSVSFDEQKKTFNLPFEVAYALECIKSLGNEFNDDLFINHKGEQILIQFIQSKVNSGESRQVVESLYRLFYAYVTGKVYNAFEHFKWLFDHVNSEYRFICKRKNSERVKFMRQAVLTPTRTIYFPPMPFKSTKFLENADTELIIRVSILDDDFCLKKFVIPCETEVFHEFGIMDKWTEQQLDQFVKETVKNRLNEDGGLVLSADRVFEYLSISSTKFGDNFMIFHLSPSDD